MANMNYATIKITVSFQKVMIWTSGLWLFILAILNACGVPQTMTKLFVHNNNGDSGAIILISAFLFTCIATFVRHKIGKLIAGILFLAIAVIGIIGAVITSTQNISTWVIVVGELIAVIGTLIWLLEGLGVIQSRKKAGNKQAQSTTN